LPLTANGKVDRKALAAADLEFEGGEYVAPRNAVEELLAGIWAGVLGVERIGIHDNFFELGGHSLLATQVISRVRESFKVELPLRSLFEAPTLSGFAGTVEQAMREEQQVEAPPLVPVSRERALPLSFAQQRLWFLDQLEAQSHAYNIPAVVRLRGPFRPEVFKQAVEEVMRRHESLRTRFVTERGRARQEISAATELTVPIVDLRSYQGTEQEQEVWRLATREMRKPFDLTRGPLLRLTVLQLAESEHVLLLTMHHIVSDGWSMGVLMRELTVLYDAFSRGESSPLAQLPIQYADYALWQREWLQGEVLERQMEYWRAQLQGAPPVLELPTDHARPAVQSFRGGMRRRRLSGELLQQIERLSRREGVTLYMSVLAAFVVVLARYSGEREIVVGTPIAGRTRQEIEELIGFFVNTLVLRTQVAEQESVRRLLERVREVCLGAYTHQELPFEQLVEELQPERDLSHQPLFQVMFELEGGGDEQGWQIGDLQVELEGVESEVAKFDLTLRVKQGTTGWELGVEYKQDLYEEETIERLLQHVELVLEGMAADVRQAVSELPLLTAAEREQVLEQWNETGREYEDETCLQQLFEAQAAARPEAVAVIFEGEQVSYGELNRRSNQLAHYLQELGVGPEVVVGLCVDRSVEMVVGLLGILKAGGAYLPLDPEYPQQRLSFMLSDASLSLLLTKESLLPTVPSSSAQILCLDAEQHLFSHCSEQNTQPATTSLNLAYVIYTSGSTGSPKGVQIHHRAVVNFLCSMLEEPGLGPDDNLLAVTSLSFDIAALEIFLPLICGAKLEVISRELAAQGLLLKERLIASQATVMQGTPATWRLLTAAGLDGLEGLQRWCGGEALSRELANQLSNDRAVVWNLYGPTETTIWSGLWRVTGGGGSVLIGRPIANTQFYVLDEQFRLVPIGVLGELYIGGDGVGRGYMKRPELTAERFVPDPFGKGTRLYRTGDVVRWRSEGELEYVERRDQQVKVRGYRIELGEIEAVLNEYPSVKMSMAAVKEDEAGNKRLVAYIVEEPGNEVSARELRENIRAKLPEYMVPTQLMKIKALPLTPNGKVDRKKLPGLEGIALVVNEYVPPRSMSEGMLANIWQRVLGVERVGMNDNFFELGGDSIVSIQIIAQARERGIQFTPKDLFQHQTIATLLEAIGSGATIDAEQGLVMGPVRLTPSQQWFFEQELSEPQHFNQSLLLEVREEVDAELLEEAAQQLLLQHDALRLRFERSESGWQQSHAAAEERISFSRIDLSTVPASDQSAAIEAEAVAAQASLDLTAGPLLRFVYFEMGAGEAARLLLVCHHLVVDGVSWRIMLEDLQQAYRSLVAGEEVQLSLKSTSYQQWAETVAVYAESAAVHEQEGSWLQSEREQVQRLPRDYEGRENLVSGMGMVAVSLSREETEALLQEVPAVYYTEITEVLLSALAVALRQWSGQNLLLIDMEGHGREPISERVDVSRTVGWFTTIYPVLLEVKGRVTEAGEVLKQVKEQMRAIPEQGLGYGMLRYLGEESESRRRLRELPQAEVVFNYTGQLDQTLSESELFSVGREDRGEGRSGANQRGHLLEVTGGVTTGQLQLTWTYSEQVHKRETVERVAEHFLEALRQLIQQCQWGEVAGFTPSDFPEAELSQYELDELVAELS
jgi:amino acid adenylation domain-containing protein/non-ribosomal peptide synthase protein (TIGR01720 family)